MHLKGIAIALPNFVTACELHRVLCHGWRPQGMLLRSIQQQHCICCSHPGPTGGVVALLGTPPGGCGGCWPFAVLQGVGAFWLYAACQVHCTPWA